MRRVRGNLPAIQTWARGILRRVRADCKIKVPSSRCKQRCDRTGTQGPDQIKRPAKASLSGALRASVIPPCLSKTRRDKGGATYPQERQTTKATKLHEGVQFEVNL